MLYFVAQKAIKQLVPGTSSNRHINRKLAQLVERLPFKEDVEGSTPLHSNIMIQRKDREHTMAKSRLSPASKDEQES